MTSVTRLMPFSTAFRRPWTPSVGHPIQHDNASNDSCSIIQLISLDRQVYRFIIIPSAVISTTVHAQDSADMEGEHLRRRKTVPLFYGEGIARGEYCFARHDMVTDVPVYLMFEYI